MAENCVAICAQLGTMGSFTFILHNSISRLGTMVENCDANCAQSGIMVCSTIIHKTSRECMDESHSANCKWLGTIAYPQQKRRLVATPRFKRERSMGRTPIVPNFSFCIKRIAFICIQQYTCSHLSRHTPTFAMPWE